MKKSLYFIVIISLLVLKSFAQTVTDIDGNTYNTVTIGAQTWMQENLRTTHYNNGIEILTTTEAVYNDTNAVYQWAYDDDSSNISEYGRLYTWHVAKSPNNVCPVGWKVPDNSDWDTLIDFLGGELVAGAKMKEVGTTHWLETDSTVTNSSGFTGLGSGNRGNPSGFNNLAQIGSFWSSTPVDLSFPRAYAYYLSSSNLWGSTRLVRSVAVGQNGKAIRCILDKTIGIESFSLPKEIQLYPNPATDWLFISFNEAGNYSLSICDLLGKTLYEQPVENKLNEIEIAFLPKGTYTITLVSEDQVFSYKFIKQ